MNKKIYLQLFLLLTILIISAFFFKKYFYIESSSKIINEDIKSEKKKSVEESSNLIHKLEYVSQDSRGNSYIIKSDLGRISNDDPDLILMKRVLATIALKDSTPITIYADNAIYNNVNYDTNFYGNVLINYSENSLNSDNMDLLFQKDLVVIFNNVFYKNLSTELWADKVEIDLITKNSKIFMNNNSKKIIVQSIN